MVPSFAETCIAAFVGNTGAIILALALALFLSTHQGGPRE